MLVVEILASAAEMVFINIGTKTGDVGKFFFSRWHLAKVTTSLIASVKPTALRTPYGEFQSDSSGYILK